ncbi:MAG: hypothetical protein DRP42_02680 [Tenericutes bacterium]|nr:MAG: hypothetical protein DRP42_02680 [Mycoplasmatota bacterium]
MDIVYDLVIKTLLEENQEQLAELFLLSFATAIISWALTEPIMMAIFANKKTVDRWKPIGFFLVNTLFLTLLGVADILGGITEPGRFSASIMLISAISAGIYASWPKIAKGLGKAAHRYSEGSKLDKKMNGDSKED